VRDEGTEHRKQRRPIKVSVAASKKAWRSRKRQDEARMGDVKQSEERTPNVVPVSGEKLVTAYLLMRRLFADHFGNVKVQDLEDTLAREEKEEDDGSAA